jgi:predicted MPP superfamily phosphohydrolase
MSQPLLTWIHISDIHFGHGDAKHGWDQRLVLQALLDDLVEQCRQTHRPDVLFVTGDIAFSGKPEQYAQARAWLDQVGRAVGIGPERMYVVPGNHDVDRSVDRDRDVGRLLGALRSGQEPLDTALANQADRKKLAARMAAYLEFAAGLAPACHELPARAPEERLFWQHRETRGRLRLRVIGLDTALLAADDQDQGRLALGNEQLARTLGEPAITPGELVIALSHHPLQGGWLRDERAVESWLRNHAHVHLSGHVHDAASEDGRSGTGRRMIRLAAGAAHGEREPAGVPPRHGYAFGSVILSEKGKLRLRVWPRMWSAKQARFVVDVHNVPSEQNHAEHELDLTLPEHGPAVSPDAGARARAIGENATLHECIEMAEVRRSAIIEDVMQKLVHTPGRHHGIVVLGARKSGRDTLIRQLQAHLRATQPAWEIVAFSIRPRALESTTDYLARMRSHLRLDHTGDRLVACINGWSWEDRKRTDPVDERVQAFANELRACLEDPAARRPFSLVAIGGYGLYLLRNGASAFSVLNIAAQVELPDLTEDEVHELMQRIDAKRWIRPDAADVWKRSGGHPFLVKRLLKAWSKEPSGGWLQAERALDEDGDYLLPTFMAAVRDPEVRNALRRCLDAPDGIPHGRLDARSAGNYLLYAGLLSRTGKRLGFRCAAVRALVEQCIADDPAWGAGA